MPKLLLLKFAAILSLCFFTSHLSLATTDLQTCVVRLQYDVILGKLHSEGVELSDVEDHSAAPGSVVLQMDEAPRNEAPWAGVARDLLNRGVRIRFGLFRSADSTPIYGKLRLGEPSDVLLSFTILLKPDFQSELARVLGEELAHYSEMLPFRNNPTPQTAAPLIEIIDPDAGELPRAYRSLSLRLDETRHNTHDLDDSDLKGALARFASRRLHSAITALEIEIDLDWSRPGGPVRQYLWQPAYGDHAILAELIIVDPEQKIFHVRVPFIPENGISEQGRFNVEERTLIDTLRAGLEYVEAVL